MGLFYFNFHPFLSFLSLPVQQEWSSISVVMEFVDGKQHMILYYREACGGAFYLMIYIYMYKSIFKTACAVDELTLFRL